MTTHFFSASTLWLCLGFFAQALFSMRFIIQWIQSERQKKSVMPIVFWYFSIAGGLCLLAYAIHKHDPVFILGQSFGCLIYFRNLYLIWKEKSTPPSSPDQTALSK